MKNPHRMKVTNRGTASEKTTRNLYEAFFAMIFVLSLLLTGCGSPMTASPSELSGQPVAQMSGEATIPVAVSGAPTEAVVSGAAKQAEASLQSFIQQTAVTERVQLVLGWLKFVSQTTTAERVQLGWTRLNSGQTLGVLNPSPVLERPDLSTHELMMWRQILLQTHAVQAESTSDESAKRLEEVAVLLTIATTPDDLMRADNVLLVPETVAGY